MKRQSTISELEEAIGTAHAEHSRSANERDRMVQNCKYIRVLRNRTCKEVTAEEPRRTTRNLKDGIEEVMKGCTINDHGGE